MDNSEAELSPDQQDDAGFLFDALRQLSPGRLLTNLTVGIVRQAPHAPSAPLSWTLPLSATRGIGATDDEIATMNAQADARQRVLEDSPAFQAALSRLTALGAASEWSQEIEYGFRSRLLSVSVPLDVLPKIQDQAADDAGITTAEARQEAAETFRRWMLQTYHHDWRQHQKTWPLLYANPYAPASTEA